MKVDRIILRSKDTGNDAKKQNNDDIKMVEIDSNNRKSNIDNKNHKNILNKNALKEK